MPAKRPAPKAAKGKKAASRPAAAKGSGPQAAKRPAPAAVATQARKNRRCCPRNRPHTCRIAGGREPPPEAAKEAHRAQRHGGGRGPDGAAHAPPAPVTADAR